MVALLRSLGSSSEGAFGLEDPTATTLLEGPMGAVARLASKLPMLARGATLLSLGGVDHLALRTRAIDAALLEAVREGATQLVVLGAGFDGRAHRLAGLEGVDVLEVDHPDTQRDKRRVARELPLRARSLRYVGVDFTRHSLAERLSDEGHDTATPTAWIFEGVAPYLPDDALEGTLGTIAERSTRGSIVCMTYVTDVLSSLPAALRPVTERAFRLLGEPLRTTHAPNLMRGILLRHGFEVRSDTGIHSWRARFAPDRPMPPLRIDERLVVAARK